VKRPLAGVGKEAESRQPTVHSQRRNANKESSLSAVDCWLDIFQAAENVKKADKTSVNSKCGRARFGYGYVPIYYKLL
jgi:hypothetical protein